MHFMKRSMVAAALLCFALLLCGCTGKIEFAQGKVRADVTELTMVLQPGETALLDMLPELQFADLRGSQSYEELMRWAEAHPDVDVKYTVSFPEGTVAENDVKRLDLSKLSPEDIPEAVELMAYLPELTELVLMPGEFSAGEVAMLGSAVEGLSYEYRFELDGMSVDLYTESVDLSALSREAAEEALELLPQLPALSHVNLGRSDTAVLSWDEIYTLIQACPQVDFDYDFMVYGKIFNLDSTVMDFNHISVPDNGEEALKAARCMKNLEVLDMDFCGVPNETMEQIRDALPDVKVIWRIWFGKNYSVRTDVEKILASKPSVGGYLNDQVIQQLK